MYRYTDEDKVRIKKARKENKNKRVEKRLQALELRAEGKSANEVAAVTGFHPSYLTQLSRKYQQGGIEAGNRRNMSFEEETAILEPFREAAEKGQLVETSEIKASYEQAIGHPIGGSQIYYVLKRHGWRKVMPRSRHPKRATEEVIETSNKLKKDFRAE